MFGRLISFVMLVLGLYEFYAAYAVFAKLDIVEKIPFIDVPEDAQAVYSRGFAFGLIGLGCVRIAYFAASDRVLVWLVTVIMHAAEGAFFTNETEGDSEEVLADPLTGVLTKGPFLLALLVLLCFPGFGGGAKAKAS